LRLNYSTEQCIRQCIDYSSIWRWRGRRM